MTPPGIIVGCLGTVAVEGTSTDSTLTKNASVHACVSLVSTVIQHAFEKNPSISLQDC